MTAETVGVDVWFATELASNTIAAATRGNTGTTDLVPVVQMMVVIKKGWVLTREPSRDSGAVAATLSAALAAAAAMAVVKAARTTREVATNYTSGIQNFSDKSTARAQ